MFSCALYPATPAFLAGVEREVRHQARRLRDHPCLALWCGNNEDLGALTWFPESRANRDRYLVDYDRLNEGVIGRTLRRAATPPAPSGPARHRAGRGDYSDNWHDDSRGDMHYWSVWHEGKPFSAYREVTPRFCSEFGYQSFPSLETIRSFADEGSLNVTSPVMEHHQRHPRGNSIITEMLTRYFRVPEGFESFVYLSQVQQALAIRTAVEYWRHLRPSCMGTLYWQLNDTLARVLVVVPGVQREVEAAALRGEEVLRPAPRGRLPRGRRGAGLGHERQPREIRGPAHAAPPRFLRHDPAPGGMRGNGSRGISAHALAPASRAPPGRRRRRRNAGAAAPDSCFLHLALDAGEQSSENELFFTDYKRCAIAQACVRAYAGPPSPKSGKGRGFAVTLSTDKPAFFVALDAEGVPGEFDDNCFTLLPDAPRTIAFQPLDSTTLPAFRKALSVRHLRDTYR